MKNKDTVYVLNKKQQQKKTKVTKIDGDQVWVKCSDKPYPMSEVMTEKKVDLKAKPYNNTQLDPDKAFERHIFHRDQFAHYFRWTHVLKLAKIGGKVLDFGSGSGNLVEVLYRNQFKQSQYLGLEYKQGTVDKANEKYAKVPWIDFKQADLVNDVDHGNDWDIICSFEVIEHVGVDNGKKYLKNLRAHCNDNTTVLISTPVYDHNTAAAGNHVVDGEVNEYTYEEMEKLITKSGFEIEQTYGTFASMKDYKSEMNEHQKYVFDELNKYYDSNVTSILMAPMFPKQSRNVIWKLKKAGK